MASTSRNSSEVSNGAPGTSVHCSQIATYMNDCALLSGVLFFLDSSPLRTVIDLSHLGTENMNPATSPQFVPRDTPSPPDTTTDEAVD